MKPTEHQEKNLILKMNCTISSAETDSFARIKLGGIANLLIQSAINSAEMLGFGFANLKKSKLFWVLSRMTIEIERPLLWNEKVEVETWPKNIDGWFYLRDFIIRDEKNEIVVRATSSWLAIDIETKRPKRMEGVEAEKFTQLRHKNAIPHQSAKLPDFDLQKFKNICPTYFDFDLNHHVTSTRYIDWMMDAISLDFHKNNFPKSMTINYVKETLPEQEIQLFYEKVNSDKYVFEGKHSENHTVAVRAEIEFSKY